MYVDFEVPKAKQLFLTQTTPITCWAACAAGVKSAQKKSMVIETSILPEPYLTAFNNGQILNPIGLFDLYSTLLKFKNRNFVTSDRDAVATFIKANAPIILSSAIVTFTNGAPVHQGYHVRLIYGCIGETSSGNEDDFQVRIFDPSPPAGFANYAGYFFTHFKYQVALKTGVHHTLVGQCWYA